MHIIVHVFFAALALCSDVLSTSWKGEGSMRICSISTGLSSSSSSQALIWTNQNQNREKWLDYWSKYSFIGTLLAVWMVYRCYTIPPQGTWCRLVEEACLSEGEGRNKQMTDWPVRSLGTYPWWFQGFSYFKAVSPVVHASCCAALILVRSAGLITPSELLLPTQRQITDALLLWVFKVKGMCVLFDLK